MDSVIKEKLEKNGWAVGNVQEFLGVSDEEMRIIEWRISLGKMLREKRLSKGYTQEYLAKKINSSQARVAKMEAGDRSVTIDLTRIIHKKGSASTNLLYYIVVTQ
jgi:hypothetical protein